MKFLKYYEKMAAFELILELYYTIKSRAFVNKCGHYKLMAVGKLLYTYILPTK